MNDDPDRVLDAYLVVLAQGGSREAFDRLTRRWTPRLVRYTARTVGHPQLAGDIVQETWMGAIRGLRKLTDPAQFPAWIYGIARRKCVDVIRVNQRQRRLSLGARAELDAPVASDPGDSTTGSAEDLAAAISQLKPQQQEVVRLFYREDLGVEEIGRVLAVPVGTVKSRLHHARESLKKLLGE
jgi:RNA polymerase sigma-70 factor (ECF subfamily)